MDIDHDDIVKVMTDEQAQLIQVMQSHATLQHQFEQLTKHVETCYKLITQLESKLVSKN